MIWYVSFKENTMKSQLTLNQADLNCPLRTDPTGKLSTIECTESIYKSILFEMMPEVVFINLELLNRIGIYRMTNNGYKNLLPTPKIFAI